MRSAYCTLLLDRGVEVRPMVLPGRFIDQDKPEQA
jgi:hypothetical protein